MHNNLGSTAFISKSDYFVRTLKVCETCLYDTIINFESVVGLGSTPIRVVPMSDKGFFFLHNID